MIISLCQQLNRIESSEEYNVFITISLYDRFLGLLINIIQLSSFHLELKPALSCYFTLNLL
jgi:hypothetical protein